MSHRLTTNSTYNEVLADFTPRSSRVNYDPAAEVIGEYQHTADLIVQTDGLSEFSVIFMLFDSQNTPVPWQNQHYQIAVANKYSPVEDPYDYYHQIVLNPDDGFTILRYVSLGTDSLCTNSFTETNIATSGNPIHFRYVRFQIPEVINHKIRMISSAR